MEKEMEKRTELSPGASDAKRGTPVKRLRRKDQGERGRPGERGQGYGPLEHGQAETKIPWELPRKR